MSFISSSIQTACIPVQISRASEKIGEAIMNLKEVSVKKIELPRLSRLPSPAKALATAVILVMGIALLGALGQIIVHDIIPTFFQAGKDGLTGADEYSRGAKSQK